MKQSALPLSIHRVGALVLDKEVMDSLTVKVILPEGAKNIQVASAYYISQASTSCTILYVYIWPPHNCG